jgi:hypothetical protein
MVSLCLLVLAVAAAATADTGTTHGVGGNTMTANADGSFTVINSDGTSTTIAADGMSTKIKGQGGDVSTTKVNEDGSTTTKTKDADGKVEVVTTTAAPSLPPSQAPPVAPEIVQPIAHTAEPDLSGPAHLRASWSGCCFSFTQSDGPVSKATDLITNPDVSEKECTANGAVRSGSSTTKVQAFSRGFWLLALSCIYKFWIFMID